MSGIVLLTSCLAVHMEAVLSRIVFVVNRFFRRATQETVERIEVVLPNGGPNLLIHIHQRIFIYTSTHHYSIQLANRGMRQKGRVNDGQLTLVRRTFQT